MSETGPASPSGWRGGGISPRKALVGAVLLVLITAAVTYAGVSLHYRGLVSRLAGGGDNLATMEELARSPAFGRFLTVLTLIRSQYVEKTDLDRLIQGATEGAVGALGDPYSAFFTAREFRDFHVQTGGEYGGIGVQVTDEGKFVVVVAAFPGTPGATTPFVGAGPGDPPGLRPKDRIVKVDGKDVVGLTVDQVVELIRGAPGTAVAITVRRPQDGAPERELTFRITRARIQVPTTRAFPIAPGIGYLQITQFLENTAPQVEKELARLKAEGARALVLDLRHNPGGRLDACVAVARLLVPEGPIVQVVDRLGKRETLRSDNPKGLGMPLAVLVDEATASASEVLAGAIQDRGVGTIIGTRTFGKGLIQQVWDLSDGTGLKLTVSKYLTPNGRDLNRRVVNPRTGEQAGGLKPDIEVARPPQAELGVLDKDPQLARAVEVLRQALARGGSPTAVAGGGSR